MNNYKYFFLKRKFDSSTKTHLFEKDEKIDGFPNDSEHLIFDQNNKLVGVCLFLNTFSVSPSIVLFCCKKFNVSECSLTSVVKRIDNVVLCHYSLK